VTARVAKGIFSLAGSASGDFLVGTLGLVDVVSADFVMGGSVTTLVIIGLLYLILLELHVLAMRSFA